MDMTSNRLPIIHSFSALFMVCGIVFTINSPTNAQPTLGLPANSTLITKLNKLSTDLYNGFDYYGVHINTLTADQIGLASRQNTTDQTLIVLSSGLTIANQKHIDLKNENDDLQKSTSQLTVGLDKVSRENAVLKFRLEDMKRENKAVKTEQRRSVDEIRNEMRVLKEQYRRLLAAKKDGEWSPWQGWSVCSATCGGGFQVRERFCTNPTPGPQGRDCVGNGVGVQSCNTHKCPGYGWSTPPTNTSTSTSMCPHTSPTTTTTTPSTTTTTPTTITTPTTTTSTPITTTPTTTTPTTTTPTITQTTTTTTTTTTPTTTTSTTTTTKPTTRKRPPPKCFYMRLRVKNYSQLRYVCKICNVAAWRQALKDPRKLKTCKKRILKRPQLWVRA